MPRIARVVVPGCLHHVTQRGNRRMQTFFSDGDYRAYVSLAGQGYRQEGLAERTAGWVCSWGDYLSNDDAPELVRALRRHGSTGRPLGDEAFLRKIGRLLSRDLVPKRPGPAPQRPQTNGR